MDIIEKLRHPNRCTGDKYQSLGNLCHEAAHEIEELRSETADLRERFKNLAHIYQLGLNEQTAPDHWKQTPGTFDPNP